MPSLIERRENLLAEARDLLRTAKESGESLTSEAKSRLSAIESDVKNVDERIAQALGDQQGETRGSASAQSRSLGDHVVSSAGERLAELRNRGHNATVTVDEFKAADTTITTDGDALVPILTDYDRTIVKTKRERPVVADLLGSGTVNGNAISYFVEGAAHGDFATVAEGALKPQMSFDNPTAETDPIRKIAGWISLTDEFLEDLPFLKTEIDNRLMYKLAMFEEQQLLRGDGLGTNIKGLLNRDGVQIEEAANAADLADALFRATTKISTATDLSADGLVIHPTDYQALRLSKDSNQQYYGGGYFTGQYGNGSLMEQPPVWGLRTVVSPVVEQGKPLVGAFRLGGTVYRKGGIRVSATNSHNDDFVNNRVVVRAEERIGLAVRVPAAFVKVELAGAEG